MAKKQSTAPFGVATKRFARIGFHPQLDVQGVYKRDNTLGPGSYKPKRPSCPSKRGMDWTRKLELEDYSKFLNYKNMDVLYQKQLQKTVGGPASIEIDMDLFKQKHNSVFENVGFGMGKRFQCDECKDSIPPPNTYNRKLQQLSTIKSKSFSNLPTFERDGFVDRFRSNAAKHTLAPNRYTLLVGGIDQTLEKVISLKGPYNLFTGPRDSSTIKNHFGPSATKVPDNYYINASTLDVLLNHPSKCRTGKFLKCVRFPKKPCVKNMLLDLSLCYRESNDPGPAHYNLSNFKTITVGKPNLHAFNTSYLNARPPLNWSIFPGPGRYTPMPATCMKAKRASRVFLSKQTRSIYKPLDYRAY